MNRRLVVAVLLFLTIAVGVTALIVGIQLQRQQTVTPDETEASAAQCCQNLEGQACDGRSCGGVGLEDSCASNNNWCWCARIANNCPEDPNATQEIMCGNDTWSGVVQYTCPSGTQAFSQALTFLDCGCAFSGGDDPGQTSCPGYELGDKYGGHYAGWYYEITECSDWCAGDDQAFEARAITKDRPCSFDSCSGGLSPRLRPVGTTCPSATTPTAISTPTSTPSVTPTGTCGDGICQESENCITCQQDCGPCVDPTIIPTDRPTDTPTTSPTDTPTATPTTSPTGTPTDTPTDTATTTPTPIIGTACNEPCSVSAGANACPNDHTCVSQSGDNGICQLNQCVGNPDLCYSDNCTPIPSCGQSCLVSEGSKACPGDHTCVEIAQTGNGVCTLNQCVNNPSECEADGCTPVNAISVSKNATGVCSEEATSQVVNYRITITNPQSTARNIRVVDNLDTATDNYTIQAGSITYNGLYSGTTITWESINLESLASITLEYNVIFNESSFRRTAQNTVVITESGVERGRAVNNYTPFCLVGTGILDSEIGRILFASILIVTGMFIYRLGATAKIGDYLWNIGGKDFAEKTGFYKFFKQDEKAQFEKNTVAEYEEVKK